MADPVVREDVYRTYWAFAAERHRLFGARFDDSGYFTDDVILRQYRFCNVFRAADRVSQHLIRAAAFGAPDLEEEDLFFRVVLHRLFCRISTWELLEGKLGRLDASTYSEATYDRVLDEARAGGSRLYTGAYVLSASRSFGHERKYRNHLALLSAMLKDGVPGRIAQAKS